MAARNGVNGRRRGRARGGWGGLRAAVVLLALGAGCGATDGAAPDATPQLVTDVVDPAPDRADAAGDADAAGPVGDCGEPRRASDGSCCPPGYVFDPESHACQAVGPPECAATVFDAPEACVPRWCWDWRDRDDVACAPGEDGCLPMGRTCTGDELAAGAGCPAGMVPPLDTGEGCAHAGLGEGAVEAPYDLAAPPPPVPPLESSVPRTCWGLQDAAGAPCAAGDPGCWPVGLRCTAAERGAGLGCLPGTGPSPKTGEGCITAGTTTSATSWAGPAEELPPVPLVDDSDPTDLATVPGFDPAPSVVLTHFCLDPQSGAPTFCTPFDVACNGTYGATVPAGCVGAGVPWQCPTGFVSASPPAGSTALLGPCAPAPADCAEPAVTGPAVYVNPAAAAGGTGTKGSPFASLGDGLAAVPSGGTVVLAAGTYGGGVVIDKAVTLAGRCAAQVTLDGSGAEAAVRVAKAFAGGDVVVRGVRITGD